jgi:hypothetical protein
VLTEEERVELLGQVLQCSRPYLAALADIYFHGVKLGLPERVSEEYVLMILRQMEAAD